MASRTRRRGAWRKTLTSLSRRKDRAAEIGPGVQVGMLTVEHEGDPYEWRGRFSRRRWVCTCECGGTTEVREDRLKNGSTRSCGCVRVSVARDRLTRHGGRSNGHATPEYWAWQSLLHRMDDVKVCRRWRAGGGKGFAAFLEDVGRRPTPDHRLTRPDPRRAFGPGNAVWATEVQRRGVPRRLIPWRGREITLHEAAERTGVPYARLCKRLERGWPVEEALRN
ncbi:hypothetical protein [Paracraurococcus lichenis]|uniref:Uncharacterized protein n=1 Tax=Paracraurococcus lichenis TaxID=3064888 RepID=A0ABT9DUP4_9PROT|nr:hypothetical protein [Paracraurococcus sp. LOR1-02]MDO9707620.1 hypothetical protein [Paracraurococcus sp. LOR1-02]